MVRKKNLLLNGFSLIEILVAVSIMTIIIGIAIASSQGSRRVARDSQRQMELEQIRSALEVYRIDQHDYPATADFGDLVSDDYLEAGLVADPVPGYEYRYVSVAASGTYQLCAYLETSTAADCTGFCCGTAAHASCGTFTCNYEVNQP